FFSAGGRLALLRLWAAVQKRGLPEPVVEEVVGAFSEAVHSGLGIKADQGEGSGLSPISFTERAQRLYEKGNLNAALDLIYATTDDWMRTGRFSELDQYISQLKVNELATDLLIGILTATLPAKKRLASRARFYVDTERILNKRGEMEPGLLD